LYPCLYSAKDLIRQLLLVDPKKRPTAKKCLQHAWITAGEVNSQPLTGAVNNMKQQLGTSYKSSGFAAAGYGYGMD
jgi:serine/threonine protein kinase